MNHSNQKVNHVNADLFQQLKESIPEEKRKEYQEIGEQMYSIDFDQLESKLPIYTAYISEALKSGMHPDYLQDNEKDIMKQAYGKDWTKRFGFD
jgi:hypothetical protein